MSRRDPETPNYPNVVALRLTDDMHDWLSRMARDGGHSGIAPLVRSLLAEIKRDDERSPQESA